VKHYTSISDFLTAHGYTAGDGEFTKEIGYVVHHIAYEQWKGLTLETFMRKARINKWVPLDPERSLREQLGEEEANRMAAAMLDNTITPLFVDEGIRQGNDRTRETL
jgi:hypothetical protein